MQDNVTLKPCDFCDGSNAFVERADLSSCYVVCNDCGARGPTSCNENDEDCAAEEAGMEPGENAARRLWNARASTTAQSEAVQKLLDAAEEAMQVIWQYKNDLHFPPNNDSMGRRLARASEVASQVERALAAHRESQP